MLDLKAQYATIKEEIDAAVAEVIATQYFINGPQVAAFEEETAAFVGVPHAIGCASGSDALLLALMALDLEPGDEVITVPYTFFATVSAVTRLGLKPVFCDIDPVTFNMDVTQLEGLITPRTKAILPVHLFGQCADMDPLLALAKRHGLAVIEDAAQAISARYKGRSAGSMGPLGCFSFFPSKNLGGFGDGGLVTTADEALAGRLRSLHLHGASTKYFHDEVGINSRLDALQAAVLRVKLPHLNDWSDGRAANADTYRRLFAEAGLAQTEGTVPEPGKVVLPSAVTERHIYNQFVIRVEASLRDGLVAHLRERKIGTAIYYPLGLHLQPCFKTLGYGEGDMPETERASRETLALPIYSELTDGQQTTVVAAVKAFFDAQ